MLAHMQTTGTIGSSAGIVSVPWSLPLYLLCLSEVLLVCGALKNLPVHSFNI